MAEKVALGKTGMYIHPVGLGANKIGYENKETNTAYGGDIISAAIEHGLNFIDTAFMYGRGLSEEIIGKTLKEKSLRNKVVLATKGSNRYENNKPIHDNTPAFLNQTVDESLKRLQTDVIDLFYIHFPDHDTPKYEAVGALQKLKEAGKIRSIGVSNFSMKQLMEANQDGYLDVVQGHYNLLRRDFEKELFPYLFKNDMSFIPYFPFASGLLAGKYTKETILSDYLKKKPQFQGDAYDRNVERVENIEAIAADHGVSSAHIVLAYYLTREPIDSVIPGARNTKQVIDNLKAAEIKLKSEDLQTIEEIFPIET